MTKIPNETKIKLAEFIIETKPQLLKRFNNKFSKELAEAKKKAETEAKNK